MEFIGAILGGYIPEGWGIYILIGIIVIEQVLPHIPEKWIKSNSSAQLFVNTIWPILRGAGKRLKKNQKKTDEDIINEYEAKYDLKRDPLNAEKKK